MRRALVVTLLCLVAVAIAAPGAGAATTIADIGNRQSFGACGDPTVPTQFGIATTRVAASGTSYGVPANGIITSYSGHTMSGLTVDAKVQLVIFAGFNGTLSQTIVTASTESTVPTAGTDGLGTFTVPTRIPVTAGQAIGLRGAGAAQCLFATGGGPNNETLMASNTSITADQAIAGTPVTTTIVRTSRTAVSARFEADADGDGYGDETQDACPAEARIHSGSGCSADLEASGIASLASVAAGAPNVLRVTLRNTSAVQDSLDPRVVVTLPAGLELTSPVSGCTGSPYVCTADRLAPGASVTIELPVRAKAAGDHTVQLAASQANPDSNASNDVSSFAFGATAAPVPPTTGPTTQQTGGPSAGSTADTLAPFGYIVPPHARTLAAFTRLGLVSTFVVSEASTGTLQLRLGTTTIASAPVTATAPSVLATRLRATKAGAAALAKAKGRSLKLTLVLTLVDPAGNVGTATRAVRLTR